MGIFSRRNHLAVADRLDDVQDAGNAAVARIGRHARDARKIVSSAANDAGSRAQGLLNDLDATVRDHKLPDAGSLRDTLRAQIVAARAGLDGQGKAVGKKMDRALGQADGFVHDKPWHTIGAVAGAALLIGFLAGRN